MVKAVLTTKIDPTYDDLPEQRYHFPRSYLRQVEAARDDWVVYYEPRRRSGDPLSRGGTSSYFAAAHIADIVPDQSKADHFYALIDSYLEFPRRVPFREGSRFYEAGLQREDGQTSKGAFGRSVRNLSEAEYDAILAAAYASLLSRDTEFAAEHKPQTLGFAEPPALFRRPVVERVIARAFRDAAFSGAVKTAYGDTCAFTGLRIINGGGRSEVQAAHVRPVANDGPDSVRNGVALCGTAHWMFDRGLLSIGDDHSLLISNYGVPDPVLRLLSPDRRLILPSRPDQAPHPTFLRWHRENVFKG